MLSFWCLIVLMASVSSEGSSVAGQSLVLTCSVTKVENITGNVDIQWIGPDGSEVTTGGSVTVGAPTTSGADTRLSLQFATLYTSDSGQYTCRGDLVSSNSTYTVLTMQDVIVQGILYLVMIHTA